MEWYTAMKKNVFDFCTNMKSSPRNASSKKRNNWIMSIHYAVGLHLCKEVLCIFMYIWIEKKRIQVTVNSTYLWDWEWMWEGKAIKGGLSNSVYMLIYCQNILLYYNKNIFKYHLCPKKKKDHHWGSPLVKVKEIAVQSQDKALRHMHYFCGCQEYFCHWKLF